MSEEYCMPAHHFDAESVNLPDDSDAAVTGSGSGDYLQDKQPAEQPKRYRTNPDYILREIAGEAILVPTGESAVKLNGMISLNETFRFLWEQFQMPHTVHEVVLAAAERFEGSLDEMKKDISDSIREMLRYGFMSEEDK